MRCLYRDRAQVLESFDIAPTKALARASGDDDAFIVEALPTWVQSLKRKAFWLDPAVWGEASPARAVKCVPPLQ